MFQQHVRTTLNVRPAMGFLSKTQIWEDHCNRPDDVDFSPDAPIHKASRVFKIQTSRRQPPWSERASYLYGNCMHQITIRITIPLVWTREALIWKIRAAEVRPSGR
jgi:hypothetical protein